ncbi:DUF3899 domain-containing protein [Staphylococcus edaphicus]|uniref:DUF3899 domain-containing protein n=1 Tax=Staphylococcus edaphicus TaxID=1955013 RepID=A0A2C6VI07_9STAP|nr:DUF3899 domain-containing protein [Staphylococcus edaphicus]PHK49861.1 hypothetical protein BTJ66_06185 [Staphylococcus edaphicus]UQW80835.1 DUF3899 domain-containing protein [Staphylococcus edaphicus]
MKNLTTYLFWLLFTPLISFVFWLFSSHHLIQYINIIFYVSIALLIIFFIILIIQEGILDPTSYGFRRLKYQLSKKKHQDTLEHDTFFKPTQAKKDHYFVNTWIKAGFNLNLLYFIFSIAFSFMI